MNAECLQNLDAWILPERWEGRVLETDLKVKSQNGVGLGKCCMLHGVHWRRRFFCLPFSILGWAVFGLVGGERLRPALSKYFDGCS